MIDDFVQAGAFVAIGSTMAVAGFILLRRRTGLKLRVDATTALFALMIVVGAALALIGMGILSLMWSTDL